MPDPRALANSRNLESYRAWKREGFQRSGLFAIALIYPLLVPFFTLAVTTFEPAARDGRSFVVLAGSALALYLAAGLGLTLWAALRLNAWKRAHPWSPPPAPASLLVR
jgi:hypothetical protein